jgi:hypothetical protein
MELDVDVSWSPHAEMVVLTHPCACGRTHRLRHKPGTATTVKACASGTTMAVGPDAWKSDGVNNRNVVVAHAAVPHGEPVPAAVFGPQVGPDPSETR